MGSDDQANVIVFVVVVIAILLLYFVGGCVQHIADVTIVENLRPDGSVYLRQVIVHGGHTAVAADSEIGRASFSTPSGWGFTLNDYMKQLDSLEFEFDPITKTFRVKTTDTDEEK